MPHATRLRCAGVWPGVDLVIGGAAGADLPLRNAFQPQFGGLGTDSFVARLSAHTMPSCGAGSRGASQALPVLAGGVVPRPGNTVSFEVRDGRASSLSGLFVASSRASIPVLGGTVLIQPRLFVLANLQLQGPGALVPYGFATVQVRIPGNPAMVGAVRDLRAIFVDVAGTLAMTNGVEMVISP